MSHRVLARCLIICCVKVLPRIISRTHKKNMDPNTKLEIELETALVKLKNIFRKLNLILLLAGFTLIYIGILTTKVSSSYLVKYFLSPTATITIGVFLIVLAIIGESTQKSLSISILKWYGIIIIFGNIITNFSYYHNNIT